MGLRDVFSACLGIKEKETVLIVTDDERLDVAKRIEKAVKGLSDEVILMRMATRDHHAQEPPRSVSSAMKAADVCILSTTMSLTHTDARKDACEAGARCASMPGITMLMLERGGMTADYQRIKVTSKVMADKISDAKEMIIKTEAGTDLWVGLAGRKAKADTGIYTEKGDSGNLPAGEAFIAPVEGLSHGIIVIDGSMGGMGRLRDPISIKIEKGMAVDVKGDEGKLTHLLDKFENARNLAEIGIGTNPKAKVIGNVLEDEKVFGTIHAALGDNHTFGGDTKAEIHLDGVVRRPDIWLDSEKIMQEGKLLIDVEKVL
jgi:leucyl aminopeptidase (aminopeptidase T)